MSTFPQDLTLKIRQKADAEAVLRKINYRPETIQRTGGTLKCFCPIHKEQIFRTLSVEVEPWTYKCTNRKCAGADGGDLIDLYSRSTGTSYEEAMMELAKAYGVDIDAKLIADYLTRALEIGENFLEMGVYAEATEQFEKLLRLQPGSIPALRGLLKACQKLGKADKVTQAMVRLAKALHARGEFLEASVLMRNYVQYNTEDMDTRLLYIECLKKLGKKSEVTQEYIHLAESLTSRGEIEEALKLYRQIEAMGPTSADVSQQIIQVLISSGRMEEAVAEMLKRANALLVAGKVSEALVGLGQAIELDPTRDDLRVRMAEIIAQQRVEGPDLEAFCRLLQGMIRGQSHGAAAQALDKLIEAFPDSAWVLELKADLEETRGHDELALEYRNRSIDIYERRQDHQRALESVDKALAYVPDHAPLLSRRASILSQLGRAAEAAEAYLAIIGLFEAAEDYGQAAAAYEAVINLEPDNIDRRRRQFELYLKTGLQPMIIAKAQALAEAYQERHKPEDAARTLERVLEFVESSPDLLTLHGDILESLGRRGEAAEQFLSAAKTYLEQNQLDKSRSRLERSLKCLPEHMESRELRADVLMRQKLFPQAIHEYNDLAQFYLRAAEHRDVIRVAGKILDVQPENLQAMQLLVVAYGQMGDTAGQRATQMRLVQIYRQQQSFTPASEICEEILLEDENYTPAVEELLAIAESTRNSQSAIRHLWKLATVHAQANRLEDEKRVIDQIVKRDPLHADANRRRLEMLAQWASPQELAKGVEQVVRRYVDAQRQDDVARILEQLRMGAAPKPEILGGLAKLRRLMGDMDGVKDALRAQSQLLARALRDDEAILILGELCKLLPEDMSLRRARIELMTRSEKSAAAAEEYRFLARHYGEHGQLEASEQAYREVLKLLPDDRGAREALAGIFIQLGQAPEAKKMIEALAAQEIQLGRFEEAVKAYERLFELEPGNEDVFRKIIAVRQRAGDVPGALLWFNKLLDQFETESRSGAFEQAAHEALGLDPVNWAIRRRLADHLLKAARVNEALGAFLDMASMQIKSRLLADAQVTVDKALEIDHDSVQGRALRAELLALQGNTESALSQFMELAGSLAELRGVQGGQQAAPFAFGNYEGLTRMKEYTFDQFVVGSRNNFAHAAALAVSRAPGKNYNPLFLYADVGLGKTHLCHAIANHVLDHYPNMKVLYTMTEDFIAGLIDAIQNNQVNAFRNRHRTSDVLIIDDIQFISGKERAQEEFFHIFNALFQAGKQIVLTSDRPPKDIAHLEKRLRSRFGAGIIVDIQTPDLETRIAILRRELTQRGRGGEMGDDSVMALGESVTTNIRDLKGALTQVLARHDHSKEPITPALIHAVVDQAMDRV